MDSLASLAQQPGMGWVNQLANDPAFANSVEWQRVKEEHDRWSYHQSGMGPVTAMVVSVVAAAVAAPMAAQAGAAAGGSAAVAAGEGVALTSGGVFMGASAPITAGVSAAVQAGVTALASRAAVSLANNDGDLGRVLQEMGSTEAVKGIVSSMLTAGVIDGLGASGLLPANVANATDGSARFMDQLQRQLIDNVAGSVVRSAVNGTSLENELREGLANALLNTAAAQGAFAIGQAGPQGDRALTAFAADVAHAMVGCAVGTGRAGSSDGCAPGAIGAVMGHLTAQFVNPGGDLTRTAETIALSQIMGSLAAAVAGGDAQALHIASGAAGNAVENNWLSRKRPSMLALSEQERYDEAVRACNNGDRGACDARNELAQLSSIRDAMLRDACAGGTTSPGCIAEVQRAQAAGNRVFVDGRGSIIINGVAFAAAGPITSPFTTSSAGQMAQATAEGLIFEAGNQIAGAIAGALWQAGRAVAGLATGTNRAVGSAADGIYASSRPMTEVFPELEGVNPYYVQNAGPGVNTNCISCVNATQQRLTGQQGAIANPSNGYGGFNDLLPSTPLGYGAPTSVSNVIEQMLTAGDGAVGSVIIQQGPTAPLHVINVVNKNGSIYFIDSQIGRIVTLQPNISLRLGRPL